MVMLSPATWQSRVFLVIGRMIAATAVGLMLNPWRWQWRFVTWEMTAVLRHMELYAAGLFAFGVFLLSGVFWRA
jgi:hypothetical protein